MADQDNSKPETPPCNRNATGVSAEAAAIAAAVSQESQKGNEQMSGVDASHLAWRWFSRNLDALSEAEKRVIQRALKRKPIALNSDEAFQKQETFGQRLADRVARFGGSWTFIILFMSVLAVWTSGNYFLGRGALDPYPFIFLNLLLSMLAAFQAPIIMMSQNRQAARDRQDAVHDYEVNLKAEIEIMALHDKLDQMRSEQISQILAKQQEQIDLLMDLVSNKKNLRD